MLLVMFMLVCALKSLILRFEERIKKNFLIWFEKGNFSGLTGDGESSLQRKKRHCSREERNRLFEHDVVLVVWVVCGDGCVTCV